MDWSPIVNEEEEFELESSDYSEWDLVTQSKQGGEGNAIHALLHYASLQYNLMIATVGSCCHLLLKHLISLMDVQYKHALLRYFPFDE